MRLGFAITKLINTHTHKKKKKNQHYYKTSLHHTFLYYKATNVMYIHTIIAKTLTEDVCVLDAFLQKIALIFLTTLKTKPIM